VGEQTNSLSLKAKYNSLEKDYMSSRQQVADLTRQNDLYSVQLHQQERELAWFSDRVTKIFQNVQNFLSENKYLMARRDTRHLFEFAFEYERQGALEDRMKVVAFLDDDCGAKEQLADLDLLWEEWML